MRRTRARPKTPFHMTIALTDKKSCSIHLLPKAICFSIPVGKGVCVGGGGGFFGKQIHYRYVYTAWSTVGHNKVVSNKANGLELIIL